jgi:anti-sigma regulatory factor (Ser/Thr protein kinase)
MRCDSTARRGALDDGLSLRLGGGPEAAAAARRALSGLRNDLDPSLVETMRLLATELVANSVRHAGGRDVTLRVLVSDASVGIEVTDAGPGFTPTAREEDQDVGSGWGLYLVDRLADCWGVTRDGDRTRVWAELRR